MKKLISSIFYVLCSLFVFATPVLAKVMYEEKGSVVISKSETVDDDLFIGAETITVDGNVLGSVFAGSGRYVQTGTIKGDLVLGTGNAMITGAVSGDVYIGAGDVMLSKLMVGGNIIGGAGNLTIDKESKIGGSLIAGSGNLKNAASIGRNLMVGAGTVYLDSKVGKEARVGGGEIVIGPNTNIIGNLTYALGEETDNLTQDPKAVIGGTTTRYTPPVDARRDMDKFRQDFGKFSIAAHRGWLIISFLGSLLLGFLLLRLFPKTGLGLSQTLEHSPIRSLGIGFLIVIFALPVMLVMAISVIGLPIVGLMIPVFAVCLIVAKLVTSYALGRFVARQFNWNKTGIYATYFVGLAIFYLLRSLPGIGWVAYMLFTWVGLGAIWDYTHSHLKRL